MGIQSKGEHVLELFLNEPSKQWHFSQIVETAKISEPSANKWLRKLHKEKIIQKVKPRGKMPYFIGNFRHENYRNRKKIYALQKMYESGLLAKLQGLKNARAIVIFGSFARSDWNSQSDVDIFVLDARWYRSPMQDSDIEGKTMLGDEQLSWLLNGLKQRGGKLGLASLCHGMGGGTAIAVELV